MPARVSIIICTVNRAEHLRLTLESLAGVHVPAELPVEVIVVDNGSTDSTAALVQGYSLPNMAVRYLHEPRRGQCYARNAGIAASAAEIIVFTDDDLRFPSGWIESLCRPLLAGDAEAVVGGVCIPKNLERSWMQTSHREWLAATDSISEDSPNSLVGANMAFKRTILEKVPRFDTELGPGALGFADETLFSFQLKEAGYRIASAFDTKVEHHFDPSRLSRASFLNRARDGGRSEAYVDYHWQHMDIKDARTQYIRSLLRLPVWRLKRRSEWRDSEGIFVWEMILLRNIAYYKQMLVEQRRPRSYDKRGLVKRVVPEISV